MLVSKSVSVSNDNELIGSIASTVETRDQMATKSDIAQMATKSDIARLEAQSTAIRRDIEPVQLRLDGMEHSIASRFELVEGEISRLRSAVYLLGKERPEVFVC